MKKYILELTEEQLHLVANCLEDINRFASGQWEMEHTLSNMLKDLPSIQKLDKRNEAREHLKMAKKVLLPNASDNSFLSYNATEFIGNTYQIYRSIYHCLAKENDWNNIYSYSALPSGNMGEVKVYSVF